MTKRPTGLLHCWEGGPLVDDGCPTTCMLPFLHDGPHEWTRDDQIILTFSEREDANDK